MAYQFPRVLFCGRDSFKDVDAQEGEIPFWTQLVLATNRTCQMPVVHLDVAADLAPGRDQNAIANIISEESEYITLDDLNKNPQPYTYALKPYHTHLILSGIEPLSDIQLEHEDLTTIYVPTLTNPVHANFPFARLGAKVFMILREPEAKALLQEFEGLVRALVKQPALKNLRGVVVIKGENGTEGCAVSSMVKAMPKPIPFSNGKNYQVIDDDEDSEEEEREERWEFLLPAPKIVDEASRNGDTRGCLATFIGKFIACIVSGFATIPRLDPYNEHQFSFQLEQCVLIAVMVLHELGGCSYSPHFTRNRNRYPQTNSDAHAV
ncbi:hypothetical protein ABKN59_009449 [Abortiporus biennis]